MPTYDYECDACSHEWELFQKITDDPVKKCPKCNKKKARRLFGTGAAIMFKGSGFYETDYRSESYKKGADKANKKEEGSSDNAPSKGDKSGDAKSVNKSGDSSKSETKSSSASDSGKKKG